jgi:hypothetical protein
LKFIFKREPMSQNGLFRSSTPGFLINLSYSLDVKHGLGKSMHVLLLNLAVLDILNGKKKHRL